jgi:nitrite reductase/ring-hydroxylating ferredoxin subunit
MLCAQKEDFPNIRPFTLLSEVDVPNWDFWDWCLAGLSAFGIAVGVIVFLLYALPQEPLVIPDVQSSIRVARLDAFPANTARLERWGDRLILVIRNPSGEVTALEGRSPADGCVLEWDPHLGRVRSPCSYQIYNPYGFVIAGLDNRALRRYSVLIRDGVINIGSGA